MLISAETKMADYACTQYAAIIIVYGECQRNVIVVAMVYSERFPIDLNPKYETTTDALHHLRETGSIPPRPRTNI